MGTDYPNLVLTGYHCGVPRMLTIGSLSIGSLYYFVIEFSLADINECEVSMPCMEICVNLPGSYRCGCQKGYVLADDGRSCVGKLLPWIENHRRKYSPWLYFSIKKMYSW